LKVADDDNNSYFEAGWDSGGMPLVKIGGVDFTGFIPQKIGGRLLEYGIGEFSSSAEFPHYSKGTLGVRLASA
jgi:hypothetical protein